MYVYVNILYQYFVASYMPYSDECLDEALEGAGLSPEEADGTVRELLPENNYIKETSVVCLYLCTLLCTCMNAFVCLSNVLACGVYAWYVLPPPSSAQESP